MSHFLHLSLENSHLIQRKHLKLGMDLNQSLAKPLIRFFDCSDVVASSEPLLESSLSDDQRQVFLLLARLSIHKC